MTPKRGVGNLTPYLNHGTLSHLLPFG